MTFRWQDSVAVRAGGRRSTTAEFLEVDPDSSLPANVIDPRRRFKKCWDAVVVTAAMYTAAVLPCDYLSSHHACQPVHFRVCADAEASGRPWV